MLNLRPHFESKTNGALILLLAVTVGLALVGKLTSEAVDALKWIGGSFFCVRTASNVTENVSISRKVEEKAE